MFKKILAITLAASCFLGCSETPINGPQKVDLTFRAAIFRKNGTQTRVAHERFSFRPRPFNVKNTDPKDKRIGTSVTTDLNGEATLKLEPGKWYVSGIGSVNSTQYADWDDVEIEVKPDSKVIEITSDSAKISP